MKNVFGWFMLLFGMFLLGLSIRAVLSNKYKFFSPIPIQENISIEKKVIKK